GGAAGFVAAGNGRGVEILPDHALRRARLLDLGDHRSMAGGDLRLDRGGEAARRRRVGQAGGELGARRPRAPLGDFRDLAGEDTREHVGRLHAAHAPPPPGAGAACAARVATVPPPSSRVAATNASSFARAAPEAMVARASSTPLAIESAAPATYSAAPALSDTM